MNEDFLARLYSTAAVLVLLYRMLSNPDMLRSTCINLPGGAATWLDLSLFWDWFGFGMFFVRLVSETVLDLAALFWTWPCLGSDLAGVMVRGDLWVLPCFGCALGMAIFLSGSVSGLIGTWLCFGSALGLGMFWICFGSGHGWG